MKLEVLLSVLNLNKNNLKKMNIKGNCTIINQCGKNNQEKYKNFDIYSFDELGTANSRNRGLDLVKSDIIIFCDDDVVYEDDYEEAIVTEFSNNPSADVIIFNVENKFRNKRIIRHYKRLHLFNALNYASYNIAFRKNSIGNIRFNTLFGPGARYNSGGDDTLFIVDCFKNGLKVYASPKKIGKIVSDESTWFRGYDEKYFFNKGAQFTVISKRFRHLLMLQYLVRHSDVLDKISFSNAFKKMLEGSKDYFKYTKEMQ